MTNTIDNIRVGSVVLTYSEKYSGWLTPAKFVIRNPLAAQKHAEILNEAMKNNSVKAVKP